MDSQSLYTLLSAHQYVLFSAVIIGLVVRLLKSDTKIPIDIPPRFRAPLAIVLGQAAGVLEKIGGGVSWKQAVFDGIFAAVLPILGQNLVIDSMAGGREIPIPGLMVPGARPGPGKPVSVKPPPIPPMGVMLVVACLFLAGCAKFFTAAEIVEEKAACVVANQDLPDEMIFAKCAIQSGDIQKYMELLSSSRTATKKALQKQAAERAAVCAPDAGPPCTGCAKTDGGAP